MKKIIHNFMKHPLISGSAVIFFGTFLANICNFFFNLFMASNLKVIDFGTLASLVSLITLPTYAANAVVPSVVQFAGKYFAEDNLPAVRGLYRKTGKFLLMVSLLLFISIIIFLHPISSFFKISNNFLIVLTDFVIFTGFLMVLNQAMLQAKLAFNFVALTNFVSSFSKLLFGVLFVFLGFATQGAISALVLSTIIPFLVTFIPLRFLFKEKAETKIVKTKDLLLYGVPSALSLLGITSFISTDILLVKHFFDAKSAGMYAGLSLIGRVVFFFTAPIGTVMFPLIVQKYNKKENYFSIFMLSISLVLVASLGITLFYFFYPDFVILTFVHKKEYLVIAPLLSLFALNISIFSVLSILVNFYLSIKATKIYIPILIGAIAQIIFISFYHKSLVSIIIISLSILFLLLILLLLYYPYATKKK